MSEAAASSSPIVTALGRPASASATAATTRNMNSVSETSRCSSSIWYGSTSTGAAASVAIHLRVCRAAAQ
ncbi:hypothetical protein ACFQE7_19130 [Nonomuraea ferruginea]|uniref:hypothetical protein n=1 Tax=Nonomuraea ferruginea TaxID=46174 RepID=UPI003622FE33